MIKKLLLTLCLTAFGSVSLWAEPLTLTVEESVAAALEQNKALMITRLQTDSARLDFENRWNSLLPGISASTGLSRSDDLFFTGAGKSTRLSAGLSLSLPLNSALAHSMEQTRIDYEGQLITMETAQKQLIRDVNNEFYYLLASKSNLDILTQNQELAEKRYQQTLENFNNGFSSELNVLQARVSAANYGPELSQARSSYENRERSFLILLGIDPETEVELTGDLVRPPIELDAADLVTGYIAGRQDIRSQQKTIESLENSRKTEKARNFTPSLSLSGGWNSSLNDPFTGSSWSDGWTDTLSMGLTLSIPLDGYIPGSSQKTALDQRDNSIRQAQITLDSLHDGARTEILNLARTIETSLEQLELAEMNVNLARRSYEMTEESYNLGVMERLDVEDAQQSYLSAVQQQLTSRYQYLSALIDLKYALNMDSIDDLYKLNTRSYQ